MKRGLLRVTEGGSLGFWCPGCEEIHVVNGGLAFGGDYDKPTFAPSVLVTGGHFAVVGHKPGDPCWCTWNTEHPDDPAPFKCKRCHSFVRDGKIEFLGDSTHALAGQTVVMQDRPDPSAPQENHP